MEQKLTLQNRNSSKRETIENLSLYEESVQDTDTDIMDSHQLLQKYIYQNQQLSQKLYTISQEKDICQKQSNNLKSFYEQEIEYYKNKADLMINGSGKKPSDPAPSKKIQIIKQDLDIQHSFQDLQEQYQLLETKNSNNIRTISVLSNKVHELQNQLESQEKEFNIYSEELNRLIKEKDMIIIEKEQKIHVLKAQKANDPQSFINCSQISLQMHNFQKQMQEMNEVNSQNAANQSQLQSIYKINFMDDLHDNASDYEVKDHHLIQELKTKLEIQQNEIIKYQNQIRSMQNKNRFNHFHNHKHTNSLDRKKTKVMIQRNKNDDRRYTYLNATQSNQNQNNVTIIASHKENGYQLLYDQSQNEVNNQKKKIEQLKQENTNYKKKLMDYKRNQEYMKFLLEATNNCSEMYKDKYMKIIQNNSNLTTKYSELFEKSQQYSQFLKQNNEKIRQENSYKNSLIQSASSKQSFLIQQNQKVNSNLDAIERL